MGTGSAMALIFFRTVLSKSFEWILSGWVEKRHSQRKISQKPKLLTFPKTFFFPVLESSEDVTL